MDGNVPLNATLSALAQALNGLGGKFGESIVNGNQILAQLNPRMPQIRHDVQRLANLAEIYYRASPDLWNFLQNAVTTARTLTRPVPGSRARRASRCGRA